MHTPFGPSTYVSPLVAGVLVGFRMVGLARRSRRERGKTVGAHDATQQPAVASATPPLDDGRNGASAVFSIDVGGARTCDEFEVLIKNPLGCTYGLGWYGLSVGPPRLAPQLHR